MSSHPAAPEAEHQHDDFVHHVAITLSRSLNMVTPNDLLAARVIAIANTSTLLQFQKGQSSHLHQIVSAGSRLGLRELPSGIGSCVSDAALA